MFNNKNYPTGRFKKIFLAIIFAAVFGLGFFGFSEKADAAELKVVNITRLSHPAYAMQNIWHGARNPWNKDYTRILMYESTTPDTAHYPTAPNGRSLIWGYVSTLKSISGGSLQDYLDNTYDIPSNYKGYGDWSIYTGEEHIIYLLNDTTKKLVKYNTNTSTATDVISYDPGDGTSITNARIAGWTTEGDLIINFNGTSWTSGGYEVDVDYPSYSNPARTRYSNWPGYCSSRYKRYPFGLTDAIHTDRSPDGNYIASYHANTSQSGINDSNPDSPTCNYEGYGDTGYSVNWNDSGNTVKDTHVSWGANDDWFVASNLGDYWTHKGSSPANYAPYLDSISCVDQIIFNRVDKTFTHNPLLCHSTAGLRSGYDSGGWEGSVNYSALHSPTLRDDSAQIMFSSTGGKYSEDDKWWCDNYSNAICSSVNANYGTIGTWVADLSTTNPNPTDVNSDNQTNIKDIQACIKVITGQETDQTIISKCQAIANPTNITNIKDIQEIIRAIIGG